MTCTRTSTTKLLLNNTASTSILSLLFECFEHRKDKWLLRWNTFIAFQFRFHMTKTNRTHSLVVCLHCVCHFMSTVVVCRIIQSKTIAFFASIVWYFFPPFLCVSFFFLSIFIWRSNDCPIYYASIYWRIWSERGESLQFQRPHWQWDDLVRNIGRCGKIQCKAVYNFVVIFCAGFTVDNFYINTFLYLMALFAWTGGKCNTGDEYSVGGRIHSHVLGDW